MFHECILLTENTSFVLADWTLCGDESAQCIERDKMCDDVIDCVNGWDERRETCPDNEYNDGMR